MKYIKQYNEKLMNANEAVSLIKDKSTIWFDYIQPRNILEAIKQSLENNKYSHLDFYYYASSYYCEDTIFLDKFSNFITRHCFFFRAPERDLSSRYQQGLIKNNIEYYPFHFSKSTELLSDFKIDTVILLTTDIDEEGYFNLGLSTCYDINLIKKAKNIIIEVNKNMPYVIGDNHKLHIDEINAIVMSDYLLAEALSIEPTQEQLTIAKYVASLIDDRSTIQLGIGTIPNMVCKELINKKDLGIHTEILGTGMVELIKKGVVTNKYKNIDSGFSTFVFGIGNNEMYSYLNRNEKFKIARFDYVNNPVNIAKIDNFISVNSAIEIDLFGSINAEQIDHKQYSASGGQADFIRGASYSKNGKSIIAIRSTTSDYKKSKIVVDLKGITTTLRNDIDYVITEYGIAKLKAKSLKERAKLLISLAHPKFREELTKQAKARFIID
ncbi:acetyl-CoA hydrolase/transferase family protein [Mycoplasma bradburyae]|uniref:Acetyl-CoA hydrolase n=1 Tax=Mycoplasma bradburyae TaxID=2963128 RepID=A0ABT5GAD7_9MOLU|nr:acetyl-CoA hydrolase/transferase C-terminal domain-containing protein [Mycoplasma bradburyae]MDC4181724.1 acetyl-CoA hydrolase [Mycoplasma bradburyae]MDC4182431.1 acetyl-CoA hydrolase [Mycoplasma bradburyae]UTS70230.1 acetyl-CoA hydrolase [Mycoplasma bradburyae]